jgi:hypothetical protein
MNTIPAKGVMLVAIEKIFYHYVILVSLRKDVTKLKLL